MASLIVKTCFATTSLLITIGTVAFASPAAAEVDDGIRRSVVQLGDLDLSRAAGRATAERRIHRAVDLVCGAYDMHVAVDHQCQSRATGAAMAALGERAGATVVASR